MNRPENIKQPEGTFHGTTNVAFVFNNGEGAVITTDRRASAGTFVASNTVKKMIEINDRTVMSIAGLPSDAFYLGKLLKAEITLYELSRERIISTKAVANLLATILHNQFRQTAFPYYVQLLIAGYDETGAHVYSYDATGSIIEEPFTVAGSGSPYAIGTLEAMWEPDMDEKAAIKTGLLALRASIIRDTASGDGMDMYVITKDGFRELSQDEIKESLGDKYPFPK